MKSTYSRILTNHWAVGIIVKMKLNTDNHEINKSAQIFHYHISQQFNNLIVMNTDL